MEIKDRHTAPHYWWQEQCEGWRHCDTQALSVIEERMPPGASETLHRHTHSEQVFFVLSGTITISSGPQTATLRPMQSLHMPAGQAHAVQAPGPQDAVFLVISTPSTREDRENITPTEGAQS